MQPVPGPPKFKCQSRPCLLPNTFGKKALNRQDQNRSGGRGAESHFYLRIGSVFVIFNSMTSRAREEE